ncbi:AraC family transcriptional regulator [Mucilaginibacter sp. UYCu711]|uniref:AraC family transcriptional regulator n=1 Tax=Mucilaginibacter sp. UYCu711 TaxID=3156339 RepID=UPI003D2294BB
MKANAMLKDFDVILKTYNSRILKPHKHQCFELIYVLAGRGLHLINGNRYGYKKGSLFLLTPSDEHGMETQDSSVFCIIDFSRLFLTRAYKKSGQNEKLSDLYKKSEYVFHSYNREKGDILLSDSDTNFVDLLVNKLLEEKDNSDYTGNLIEENIVFLLLQVIGAHIHKISTVDYPNQKPGNIMQDITAYIHQHIYDKELLTMEAIASCFNKSPDYVSVYFKKMASIPLKEYILQYKLNLVKTRLLYSDLNISEIAYELGFTDESHLNKTFKKHSQMTASQFRHADRGESLKNT